MGKECCSRLSRLFVGTDDIPAPPKTPAREAIHIPKACKATLFGRGFSLVNHYRESPQHFSLPYGISLICVIGVERGGQRREKGRLPRMLFSIIDLCYKISNCSLRSRLL